MQQKSRILIVEDDKLLTSSLKEVLISEGYLVDIAENASQAEPLLSTAHCALIDLCLPDKTGIQVLQELKQINPEAEILIVTGFADTRSAIDAVNLGAFAYLEKPIKPENLFHFIKRALEKRQLTIEVRCREQEIKGLTGFTGTILNDRVLMLEEAKVKEERLSKLYQGISQAFQSSDPLEAARELLPLIADATGANHTALMLVNPEDETPLNRVDYFNGIAPFKLGLRPGGISSEVIRTKRPLIIPDLLKSAATRPVVIAIGLKSAALFPLKINEVIYGILYLYSLKEDAFSEQKEIISSFADLCAIPIKIIEGYQEAEMARQEWEIAANEVKVGIVLMDKERKILRTNRFFAQLVGKPVQELLGKKICEALHRHPEPIDNCPLEKACQTGEPSSVTMVEPFLNNKKLELIISPVKTADGKVSHFVYIVRVLESLPAKIP